MKMFNSFTPMEITVLIVFVFYLMFNIDTPEMIAEIVETPIGLLSIMVMIMYLFFYGNPIIAIIFIFVASLASFLLGVKRYAPLYFE